MCILMILNEFQVNIWFPKTFLFVCFFTWYFCYNFIIYSDFLTNLILSFLSLFRLWFSLNFVYFYDALLSSTFAIENNFYK